jgi:flagellar biosynthesis/type III secretory pathway protein FliH
MMVDRGAAENQAYANGYEAGYEAGYKKGPLLPEGEP